MKTLAFLSIAILTTASATGCGCCRAFMPAPQPVACAPACPPAPMCDPCATAPVTYGTAPTTTFAPAPTW